MASEQVRSNVIITGAAGGIGQALVRCFAEAGYGVIATDKVEAPADLPCQHYIRADLQRTVAEPDYASEIFADIRSCLAGQPLKALVNNAAVQILGPTDTLSRDDWRTTLDVNLLAPFFWAQALLPELEAAGGMVLNISSIHAHLTKPNFVAYATSKAALSGLTRAMAVELGQRVRVNAIEPAAIDTEMLRAGFAHDPIGLQRLHAFHPTRCIGSPADLARLALSLIHLPGIFFTGAVVGFDGAIRAALHDPT